MKKLFFGGNIITMAKPGFAEAVAVEDGVIAAVGDLKELENSRFDEKIDLKGKTLIPAFIDSHSHFLETAQSFLQVSLQNETTFDGIKRKIQDFIIEKDIKKGEWVTARDYDNNSLKGAKHLPLHILDEACPHNPLVIKHKSGHVGLMNTKAMELFSVTLSTPEPEGGKIEKLNGSLTGLFEENAFFEYLKKIPLPGEKEFASAAKKAENLYFSNGITLIQEGMAVEETLKIYGSLFKNNCLKADIRLYSEPSLYEQAKEFEKNANNPRFKTAGIKIFLDGSPQSRTAWLRQPYKDSQERGISTMSNSAVLGAVSAAAKRRTQIIAHCNGDAAAEQFLNCLEAAENQYPCLKTLRPVIIHGQLMGVDQLQKAARLKAVISFFAAHIYHWGDVHIKNLGFERASMISPAASAVKAGIPVTFHQDTPVVPPDMIETLKCAVNRVTKNGVQLSENERLSAYEALKAVTANAAYQYFEEAQRGTIEKGKKADFAVLSGNPLDTGGEKSLNIKVTATFKEGEAVYQGDG